MRPGGPQGMKGDFDPEELEKYNEKQNKKLRKIIGDENFAKIKAF